MEEPLVRQAQHYGLAYELPAGYFSSLNTLL
jgi:hypothetical protein